MTFLQKSTTQKQIGDGTLAHCGLCVYDVADERHVGRIKDCKRSHAVVRWIESGWLSEVNYSNLRQAANF